MSLSRRQFLTTTSAAAVMAAAPIVEVAPLSRSQQLQMYADEWMAEVTHKLMVAMNVRGRPWFKMKLEDED